MTRNAGTGADGWELQADNTWTPIDILGDWPTGTTSEEYLQSQGWAEFTDFGITNGRSAAFNVWRRNPDDYLIELSTPLAGAPPLLVHGTPALLGVLTGWAPLIQAAVLSDIADDLQQAGLDSHGLVEALGARAAYGADTRDRLLSQQRERQRQRRATARPAQQSEQ